MKSVIKFAGSALAAAALLFGSAATASAQLPNILGSNPGIVMAGSESYAKYPKKAQQFVKKHFKGVPVTKAMKLFAKQAYEVELANGVDIEFDSKGNVREIDAPDRAFLPASVVKDIMPGKSFRHLANNGFANLVESIEFKRGKAVEVELGIPSPDTYVYDIAGNFIRIED